MTPADNAPTDAQRAMSTAATNDALQWTINAFGMVVERITPWLLDLGNWIFGALIAFNLLILGALLTVGPGDVAVVVSTAALAVSLPMDVAGFFLLRLAQDMKQVDLEEVATQAFQEWGLWSKSRILQPMLPRRRGDEQQSFSATAMGCSP